MQSTVPWKQSLPSVLLPRPVSCVSTFLGMWCVALEMTLAIHVFNDLKQFTSQLKQDLSCDNPEKILSVEGAGKWISLLGSAQVAPACSALPHPARFCLHCPVPRLLAVSSTRASLHEVKALFCLAPVIQ